MTLNATFQPDQGDLNATFGDIIRIAGGGPEGGVTREELEAALRTKADFFETDRTLTLRAGVLSVNTTDVAERDNTLPITSAGVETIVGNIDALLKTI